MNPILNVRRLSMLISKHWAENKKWYLLSLPAMGGLILAWYVVFIKAMPGEPLVIPIQYVTYYTGLFLAGCLFGSIIFSELNEKPRAVQYLLVPASTLEKLLCAIFFGVFLFFTLYTLVFYVVDMTVVQFLNHRGLQASKQNSPLPGPFKPSEVVNIFRNFPGQPGPKISLFLVSYFAIQSIFILGSVYFTRAAFIKTTVFLFIIGVVLFLLIIGLFNSLNPVNWQTYRFTEWVQYHGALQTKSIRLPGWMENIIVFLLWYTLPFIFWFITYTRLKEKEV